MSEADNLRTAGISRANALARANAKGAGHSHGQCVVCGGSFDSVRGHQNFCSPRCRLLKWAARVIADEYLAGRLPGLDAEIARLR